MIEPESNTTTTMMPIADMHAVVSDKDVQDTNVLPEQSLHTATTTTTTSHPITKSFATSTTPTSTTASAVTTSSLSVQKKRAQKQAHADEIAALTAVAAVSALR
uniref:Uncharacterized protein n=1 Tax=Lygus hesperus TaxID=30085 RepID=A0A0A9VSB3_LYGHE